MEILDELINKLKTWEREIDNYEDKGLKEVIFPIRRLAESEKVRQLKEGVRIKVHPLFYDCPYCPVQALNPETFFTHMVDKHLCPGEEARKHINEQLESYTGDINKLEGLVAKYTEVLLDVDYTDKTRDT